LPKISIINSIRDSHTLYRPIIFYSAGQADTDIAAIKQLENAITDANLVGKGVFITSRGEDLKKQARDIFNEMHNEEHKINRVRGLLMDQVSELDASIINVIAKEKVWNDVQEDKRYKVTKEFKERVNQKYKNSEAVFEATKNMEYEQIKKYILDNPRNIDTFSKGKILREMLKHIDGLKGCGTVLSKGINGDNSLIAIRNSYGHMLATELEKDHDTNKCKLIRNETRLQVENITEVSKYK